MASGPFTVGAGLSQGNQHGSGAGNFAGLAERLADAARHPQTGREGIGPRDSKLRRGLGFGRSPSPKGHPSFKDLRKTRKSRSPFARDPKDKTPDPWRTYRKSKGIVGEDSGGFGGENSAQGTFQPPPGGFGGENSAQGTFQPPPTHPQPPQFNIPQPPPGLDPSVSELFKMFAEAMRTKSWGTMGSRDLKKFPILDERHFRRVDKFGGIAGKFKSWVFDVLVGVGMASGDLQRAIKDLMARERDQDPWA